MITRRLEWSLTPVVGLMVVAAVVLGHAVARFPSAHLGSGALERSVLAELAVGFVLAIVATAAWMADGAHRSSGSLLFSRVILIGLLAGAAITGVAAILTEAGNGCIGACG